MSATLVCLDDHRGRQHRPGDLVARWAALAAPAGPVACDGCGTTHTEPQCPTCRQPAGPEAIGYRAVIVETAAGARRLVIARRDPTGGWTPTRTIAATGDAVRTIAGQHGHGTTGHRL
jgi:hypothetical protein